MPAKKRKAKSSKKREWEHWHHDEWYGKIMADRAIGKQEEMEQVKQLIKVLKPIYKPGMKVLDVGCGCGHFYPSLRKLDKNIDFTGVDVVKNYIDLANKIFKKAKPRPKFFVGDIFNLKKFGKFDIVFSHMVLHCIPNHEKALRELAKATKKHLLIRAMVDDYTYLIKVFRYKDKKEYSYYNIYAKDELDASLKKSGFSKVKFIKDEFNVKLKKKKGFGTYTYGKLLIIGNIVMNWKLIHAVKAGTKAKEKIKRKAKRKIKANKRGKK